MTSTLNASAQCLHALAEKDLEGTLARGPALFQTAGDGE